jgi:pilus assembly protein Flp/PilA
MLDFLRSAIFAVRDREEGQALVEYALILALVSVVAAAALGPLGQAILGVLNNVAQQIGGA